MPKVGVQLDISFDSLQHEPIKLFDPPLTAMSRFTQVLLVSPMDDGNTWVLMRDFGYEVGTEASGEVVDVQIGFMTDFASVPWFFQGWIPKWGKYGNAAVIHDWLYWTQSRTREASDLILLEAMEVMGVDTIRKSVVSG